jgi:hypothetical protein
MSKIKMPTIFGCAPRREAEAYGQLVGREQGPAAAALFKLPLTMASAHWGHQL